MKEYQFRISGQIYGKVDSWGIRVSAANRKSAFNKAMRIAYGSDYFGPNGLDSITLVNVV